MQIRTQGRVFALQILYQLDISNDDIDDIFDRFWKMNISEREANLQRVLKPVNANPKAKEFTTLLVEGVLEHLENINEAIVECLENWEIHRMQIIDRCILRSATYEIFYLIDIPPIVTINEAIELAKGFSTEESGKFVNAVLDKVKDLAEDRVGIEHLRTVRTIKEVDS